MLRCRPELGLEPRRPTSQSSLWLPQVAVSMAWSGRCSVGTEIWDCRQWQRRHGAQLTTGVTAESSLRLWSQWCLDEGAPCCTPRRLFCG